MLYINPCIGICSHLVEFKAGIGHQRDHRAHEILLCIQTGKKLEDINRMSFSSEQFYVKSPEIMAYDFRNHPVAIKNTLEIAERCGLLLEFGQVHMPRFNLGTGETLRERFERDTRAGFEQRVGKLVQLGELSERKLVFLSQTSRKDHFV